MDVLDDERLKFLNNSSERAIKPFAIERSHFISPDTPRKAKASAGTYSVVTTVKMNDLNPRNIR